MEKLIKQSTDRIVKGIAVTILIFTLLPIFIFTIMNDRIEKLQDSYNRQTRENVELKKNLEKMGNKIIDANYKIAKIEGALNGK